MLQALPDPFHTMFVTRTRRVPLVVPPPPIFSWVCVARSFVFCVVFCRFLFVLLWFFFWPLRCLFFIDIQNCIAPVVSFNSSYKPTVFRLLTDFVCLYNCEFWLSLCKIVRSLVILLLPLFLQTRHNIISRRFNTLCKTEWLHINNSILHHVFI